MIHLMETSGSLMHELASVISFLKTHTVDHETVELTRKTKWPVFLFPSLGFYGGIDFCHFWVPCMYYRVFLALQLYFYFFFFSFFKYILLIMLLHSSHPPTPRPSLHSILHIPSLPHSPPIVHVHGSHI